MVKTLLERGVDTKAVSKQGKNAFHYACDCAKASMPILKALYCSRTDINAVDQEGRTPFNYAVDNCLIDAFEFLFDMGARPNMHTGM